MEILATQLAELFSAVQRSDEKQIRRLLAANISPTERNRQGITALMVATNIGNSKIIKMLREAIRHRQPSGQLFFSQMVSTFSTAVSPTAALTAFMAAEPKPKMPLARLDAIARTSNVSTDSMLTVLPNEVSSLSPPPAIDLTDQRVVYHIPPLATVAHKKATEALAPEVLAEPPEHPSLETQSHTAPSTNEQTEQLKTAVRNNDLAAVTALLAAGVSVQSKHWYDTPVLVTAAKYASSDIVKVLIQAGASVNRGYDRLPLNVASERGNFEIVHTLMCAGAYLEATEENGHTALMCAAAAGHLLIVQTLIACGAKVNVNYYGKTPLMLAATNGHTKVYDFLYPYRQAQGLDASDPQQHAQRFQIDREMFSMLESSIEASNLL